MTPLNTPARPQPKKLIAIGLFVVICGLLIPKLISGSPPQPLPQSSDARVKPVAPLARSSEEPATPPPSPTALLVKMIVGIALFGGVAIALARSMKNKPLRPAKNMEVLASLNLDARCMLHLVQAGPRRLLIGMDATGAKTLTELPQTLRDYERQTYAQCQQL